MPLAVPPRLGQSSTATSPGGAGRFRQQEVIPQPHGLAGCGHAMQRGCPKPPLMPLRPPQPQAAGGRTGLPPLLAWPPATLGTGRDKSQAGGARSQLLHPGGARGRPEGLWEQRAPPDRAHLEPAPAHLCCGWEDGSPPGPSRAGPYLNCPHALWSVRELMLRRPGAICQCSNGRLLLMNNITAPFLRRLPASGSGDARPQPPRASPPLATGPGSSLVTCGSPAGPTLLLVFPAIPMGRVATVP